MKNLRMLFLCITFMVCFSSTEKESQKKPREMTFGENDFKSGPPFQENNVELYQLGQNTTNEQDSFYTALQNKENSFEYSFSNSQKHSSGSSNEGKMQENENSFDLVPTTKQSTGRDENFQFSHDENEIQRTEERTELIKSKLSSYFADKDFLFSGEKKNQPFISFKKSQSFKSLLEKDAITSKDSPPIRKTVGEIMNEKKRKNLENKSFESNYLSIPPKNPSQSRETKMILGTVKNLNVQSPRKISETLNKVYGYYPEIIWSSPKFGNPKEVSPEYNVPKSARRFSEFGNPKEVSPEYNVPKSARTHTNLCGYKNLVSKKYEIVESNSDDEEKYMTNQNIPYNSFVKSFLILNEKRMTAIAQNTEYEKLPSRPPSTQEIFNLVKNLPSPKKHSKKIPKTLEKIYGTYPERMLSPPDVKNSNSKNIPSIFHPYVDKFTRENKEIANFENKDHSEKNIFARKSEMMKSYSTNELHNIQEQTASEIAYRSLNPDEPSAFRKYLQLNLKIEEHHDCITGTSKTIYKSNDDKIMATQIKNAFGAIVILNHETQEVMIKGKDKQNGGSALGKDLTQVKDIFATLGAFAALKVNGDVEVWGNSALGGKLPLILESEDIGQEKLKIKKLISNKFGFAALLYNGTVISWGDLMGKKPMSDNKKEKIKDIVATSQAFAAHTENDSVYTWGNISFGGDKNDSELEFIELIVGSTGAFAAKIKSGYFINRSNEQGNILIWGDKDSLQEAEDNLKQLDVKSNLLNLLN